MVSRRARTVLTQDIVDQALKAGDIGLERDLLSPENHAMVEEWQTVEHALAYLARADGIPHRAEGEASLVSEVPADALRILDLGTGDGRLLALLLAHCPEATGVAVDFSPAMIEKARARFDGSHRVRVIAHDLADPLSPLSLGPFDVVVSSLAIHHLIDARKRRIYEEIRDILTPGGVFANLEHVSSPTVRLHARFLEEMGLRPEDEDRANKLLDVETQLGWLRQLGFEDVDCIWKWRELALLVGRKPAV